VVRINNGGEIPQSMGDPSFLGIARAIRSHREFRLLYKYLNHSEESGWKQEAYQYSKKVIETNKGKVCNQNTLSALYI
jgi:hypothetical protein